MSGTTFSRFVIAPSDDELAKQYAENPDAQPPALQCARLGAFGGFFEREFRAHDYALGRRNCQKFLRDHFILPEGNVVMHEGLSSLPDDLRRTVIKEFRREAPRGPDGKPLNYLPGSGVNENTGWLPIVPLCTPELRRPIEPVPRFQ